ncbi:MAG: ATP-binding cassette domain-containing protein [Lachnospiraceae bacterium]|nr:ATP-binding cassette domain-containing protein [Lachnospiraceae bacterium]
MAEQIIIENVSKVYTVDDHPVRVFDGLNLEIDPGERTVLIGKSGCGKTTLLRLISGLEEVSSGNITLPEELKIGMVFQEPRLMPWLTCEKNITLGMKKPSEEEVMKIISLVGLAGFEKAYPGQMSGGMKQRAALARTLIRNSNLLLMDEPFAALDVNTRRVMQDELLRICAETGAGVIFVTHDLNEAQKIGSRIISLDELKNV